MSPSLILVSLDWIRPKDPRMSLGHASLMAQLGAQGVGVIPVARAVNDPAFRHAELLAAILQCATPSTDIAIGVYVWNEPVVQWLLPALRRGGFVGRILLGGPQISYAPPGIQALYPSADGFIRGYAEDALAAVVASDARITLPGVSWRGGPDLTRPASVDLASLTSPILSGVLPIRPFMRWETQRGCIYKCSFCQHRESGERLRHHTLANERIASEIDALVSRGAREIAVLDPIFQENPAAQDILRRFERRGYAGSLSLQSRFESIDDAFLDRCGELDIRLEFGLQTVHRAEMLAVQRLNNLASVEKVIAKLHARRIPFEVSLIYGLPMQTLTSFKASVRWCLERGVPVVKAFPLMLLRGTGIDRDRSRWGLVESDDAIPVVVSSATFTREEWERMRAIADDLDGAASAVVRSAA